MPGIFKRRKVLYDILNEKETYILQVRSKILKDRIYSDPVYSKEAVTVSTILQYYDSHKEKIDSEVDEAINKKINEILPVVGGFDWPNIGLVSIFLVPPLYPLFEYLWKLKDSCEPDFESMGCCSVGILLLILALYITLKKAIQHT